MIGDYHSLSPAERDALKQDFFSSLHCALPGNIISFDAETQTAEIQPAVKLGSLMYPPLSGVPVYMPVRTDVNPGDPCLVVFADIDIDAWLSSGEAENPLSARRHSLSDGFAFIGFLKENRTDKKDRQEPVADPAADGTGVTFIDAISQNENGVITPHKKTVRTVSKSGTGLCPALPNENTTTKYLRQDGQWTAPPFVPSSILPGNDASTRFRCSQGGYVSGAVYFKLCSFPKSTNNTRPTAIIRGRVGGWNADNVGMLQALINNRDAPTMTSFMQTASGTEANVFNLSRIVCYQESNGDMTVYMRASQYYCFDVDIEANGCTIIYDGTSISSPGGTLVLSSDTVSSRMSLCRATLYVNGTAK